MGKLLSELDLAIQTKAKNAIKLMQESLTLKVLGVEDIQINEARRALSVQMAYYSRSRMSVKDVQAMYRAAGLYNIGEEEAKRANTQTLESKHIKGLAVDIVPIKGGKIWWNAPKEVWDEMGKIGKSCGLKWGGDWKGFSDTPHFEV